MSDVVFSAVDFDIQLRHSVDRFVSDNIATAVEMSSQVYHYSIADLDEKVNEDETLREYLLDSMHEFSISETDLETLSDAQLNLLITQCDALWKAVLTRRLS